MTQLKKVLIVEDEEVLRDLYETILSTDGCENKYQVKGVGSAEEAKEVLSSVDYDVILTDYKLPGESGIDLIRWVASREQKAKCIVLSGFLESSIVKSAFEAGAILCLKKPCGVDKILSAVDQAAQQQEESGDESFLIESVIEANVTETLFVDTEYKILFANQMFLDNYGQCVNKRCFQMFGTGAGVCPNCQAVVAAEERKSKTRFRSARDPNGCICEIQERIDPWYTGDNRLLGLVLSFSKMGVSTSEQENPERVQRETTAHFDDCRVLVFALDKEGNIAYAGEQFLCFLGLDHAQVIGKNLNEFLDESFVAKLNRQKLNIVQWFSDNIDKVVPINLLNTSSRSISTFLCDSRLSDSFNALGWEILVIARRNA